MYTFLLRPRWLLFHLLCIAGVALMISLGFWQLRRLDERQQFNAEVSGRIDLPVAPLDEVLTLDADPDQLEWRSVSATGTYLPAESLLVVNRSQYGRAGDIVVTPLQLDDGRVLLVERGFTPLGTDVAAPPVGEVELVGRLHPSQQRRRGQLSDPSDGELTEAQRLDVARLAPQLPGPAVEMYVDLVESRPAEPGPFPEPLALPERDDGPHLSYALQWFVFSIAVAVGWVFAVRRSISTRRVAASRTASPGVAVEGPTEVGVAPRSSPG